MFHLSTIDNDTYRTLQYLFTKPVIREQFALAGGTALALQTGHRKSIDLDIFSPTPFDTHNIELMLAADSSLQFDFVNRTEHMLFCYINNIKCDFIYEPAALIQPFIKEDGVACFHVEDITAMKMHTICGRGKRKDFFDIYVLIELFGWEKMLQWFEQKYGSNQYYFLWRSITYFDDANEDAPVNGLPPYTKSWEEIKEYILEHCS